MKKLTKILTLFMLAAAPFDLRAGKTQQELAEKLFAACSKVEGIEDIDEEKPHPKPSVKSHLTATQILAEDNPYKILGVSRTATKQEIQRAYKSLSLLFHPDKNPGDKTAEEAFKKLSLAYEKIGFKSTADFGSATREDWQEALEYNSKILTSYLKRQTFCISAIIICSIIGTVGLCKTLLALLRRDLHKKSSKGKVILITEPAELRKERARRLIKAVVIFSIGAGGTAFAIHSFLALLTPEFVCARQNYQEAARKLSGMF
jgi:hypothetical protein